MPVKNFTTAWNDGIAIASLVESTAPGLFPDWDDLKPENALANATDAMQRAEDWLGVPQVGGLCMRGMGGWVTVMRSLVDIHIIDLCCFCFVVWLVLRLLGWLVLLSVFVSVSLFCLVHRLAC